MAEEDGEAREVSSGPTGGGRDDAPWISTGRQVLADDGVVPDWTYLPLRGVAAVLLGGPRSRRLALRSLAGLVRAPGGGLLARALVHPLPSPDAARLGAVVPQECVADAAVALPVLGAGAGAVSVSAQAVTASGSVVPPGGRAARHPEASSGAVVVDDPDVPAAAGLLRTPGVVVLATSRVLTAAGPGWFQRVLATATPTLPPDGLLETLRRGPRRWPAWWWGLVVGAGMVVAGLGAALITIGPVLLWYDRDHLGTGPDGLLIVSPNLIGFVQHDRITMAGTMVTIGLLYAGLAWGGIRTGRRWARTALLVSGLAGFPTLLHFLVIGFFEPLHALATAVLVPLWVLAVRRPPDRPAWTVLPEGPQPQRVRAAVGQLLMVVVAFGLFVGGAVITVKGLSDVFVPTDLDFLGTDAARIQGTNPRLIGFIAHDRAGFGGALMAAALAIGCISAWGWDRGARWVWWALAAGAVTGFVPTLAVHLAIGYTAVIHLAPVYLGVVMTAVALALARPYLLARS